METPLEVVFTLDRPMRIPASPIHLDALLAWAVVDEATEAGHPDPWSLQHELPLERHESDAGSGWVWKASMLRADQLSIQFLVQRSRPQDGAAIARAQSVGALSKSPNTLPSGTGRYKQFLISDPMQWVTTLTAWCISADPGRTAELLQRISYVGKLRGLGAGRVKALNITENPDAQSLWMQRAMPDPLPGYVPVHGTLRVPYWDRAARTITYMPGDTP